MLLPFVHQHFMCSVSIFVPVCACMLVSARACVWLVNTVENGETFIINDCVLCHGAWPSGGLPEAGLGACEVVHVVPVEIPVSAASGAPCWARRRYLRQQVGA